MFSDQQPIQSVILPVKTHLAADGYDNRSKTIWIGIVKQGNLSLRGSGHVVGKPSLTGLRKGCRNSDAATSAVLPRFGQLLHENAPTRKSCRK